VFSSTFSLQVLQFGDFERMDLNAGNRRRRSLQQNVRGRGVIGSKRGSSLEDGSFGMGVVADEDDPRLAWMMGVVRNYFPAHSVSDLVENEDNVSKFDGFLNSDRVQVLYFTAPNQRSINLHIEAPPDHLVSMRMLYFFKLAESAVSREAFATEVIVGDCNEDPVDHLEQITQSVYLPLFSNVSSHENWHSTLRKEMMESVNSFVSTMQITSGLMRGETLLPLPHIPSPLTEEKDSAELVGDDDETGDLEGEDPTTPTFDEEQHARGADEGALLEFGQKLEKKRALTASAPNILLRSRATTSTSGIARTAAFRREQIHMFEGCVVTWTRQIKNVLASASDSQLSASESHPGPSEELRFWRLRASNLNFIFKQLQGEDVRRVLKQLDEAKSTYNKPFAKLCRDAEQARAEAESNAKFFSPLEPYFQLLEVEGALEDTADLFPPIMHIVLLIWKHSPYYNEIGRLVVLMRQLSNAVIARCRQQLNGQQLFQMISSADFVAASESILRILRVVARFKSAYFDTKAKTNLECKDNAWKVQNSIIFARLDLFLERCHDLLDFVTTVSHFESLHRIEIGGTKGKTLTMSISQISRDFSDSVRAMMNASYDVLDIQEKQFEDDFSEFRTRTKEQERRIASVLSQAFDDCVTLNSQFKLLDCFEQLVERPIVQDELEGKHMMLLETFGADLTKIQHEFYSLKDSPPIASNLPPIAGALTWCRGLVSRISVPMQKFRELKSAILERETAREVTKRYTALIANLNQFEEDKRISWESCIESSSISKLKLPVLVRNDGESSLKVNFDPALVQLLREVKYFLLLKLDVPSNALSIYQKAEELRRQTGNLELIVQIHNKLRASLLPVEEPLLRQHFIKIDKVVQQGLVTLTWKSHGVDDFIANALAVVEEADDILGTMKAGMKRIQELADKWTRLCVVNRMAKAMTVDDFSTYRKRELQSKFQVVTDDCKEVHRIVKDILKKIRVSTGHPDWKAYVEYLNEILLHGLCSAAAESVAYIAHEIDPSSITQEARLPLLEVDLALSGKRVLFAPNLERTPKGDGIEDMFAQWIASIFSIGSLNKRLDCATGDYVREIMQSPEVMREVDSVHKSLAETIDSSKTVREEYNKFEYLWTTDMNKNFADFLDDGALIDISALLRASKHQSSKNDRESDDESSLLSSSSGSEGVAPLGAVEQIDNEQELSIQWPNLAKFEERINYLQGIRARIADLSPTRSVGFLRINTQPIKQALSMWVTKWIYVFTQYLHGHVISTLEELNSFMQDVEEGLNLKQDAEYLGDDELMQIMQLIADVRQRMPRMQYLFQPIEEILLLLRKQGISFESDEIGGRPLLEAFRTAPQLWDATVNVAFKARERIQSRQAHLAHDVGMQGSAFGRRLSEFREEFLGKAPLCNDGSMFMPAEQADEILAVYQEKCKALQKEAENLHSVEKLCELQITPTDKLDITFKEIQLLRGVWSCVDALVGAEDSWRALPWDKIEVSKLVGELEQIRKQVEETCCDPDVQQWGVFVMLQSRLQNISSLLPVVESLQSLAVRERHWGEIFKISESLHLELTAKFSFADVLSMGLHRYLDQVLEVVDVAEKELKIDQRLTEIEQNWKALKLPIVPFKQQKKSNDFSDFRLLVIQDPESLLETLEEHQVQLQSLIGMGKFVDYFRERVQTWQHHLGLVESALVSWLRAQKSWMSLQSIFLAGADIKSELPEDTIAFASVTRKFQELYTRGEESQNALQACIQVDLHEKLSQVMFSLEKCQKALNEYLEKKKQVFPRFFFMSNEALLEVLSNGSDPRKIMPHLNSCFHGISSLDFVDQDMKSKSPAPQRARGMISPQGEKLFFRDALEIRGAVEDWLNDVTLRMRSALQSETSKALAKLDEQNDELIRQDWATRFPAQVVLLASQITWTEEVDRCFADMEAGKEDTLENYLQVCRQRLPGLVRLVHGKMKDSQRTKLFSLIMSDVHARDVVAELVSRKVESADAFAWRSQLRFRWSEEKGKGSPSCEVYLADFVTTHSFEYIGNVERLVVTPLTDRCFITLATALKLTLGGAPSGPAGTGKTETTKDLSRSFGLACYVFNCSAQMNFQTLADIFKGLCQTGAWGCFDEFNRIPIEVLSVVATQVKCILDAIRLFAEPENRKESFRTRMPAGKPSCVVGTFDFMGTSLRLIPTTGFFITMNPGYAGRTELPGNLKALFRSCAMVRPDIIPICEIMLMAEGFVDAVSLSVKIVMLYRMSSEMLSNAHHYDWGLRSIKCVLRSSGKLRRKNPTSTESAILLRALRDYNLPKLIAEDVAAFQRVVEDIFPNVGSLSSSSETMRERVTASCGTLQQEEVFVNKILELHAILEMRHSAMILGPSGCGKSSVLKTLVAAHNHGIVKRVCCCVEVLNPKALSNDELFGFMTMQKDWKDGALSSMMRKMSKQETPYHSSQNHQWIVLDGEIDADWIESMNTVMDDNKVLTLVSNERIPLLDKMRLIFEIDSLSNATPATVSRAGILYINEQDIGWKPLVESWISSCAFVSEAARAALPKFFDTYVEPSLQLASGFASPLTQRPASMVTSLVRILEALLKGVFGASGKDLENIFVFSLVWAFAGALGQNREKFTAKWMIRFKERAGHLQLVQAVQSASFQALDVEEEPGEEAIPSALMSFANFQQESVVEGDLFNFFFDELDRTVKPWSVLLQSDFISPLHVNGGLFVPTISTVRNIYVIRKLTEVRHAVLLVGSAGTGKSSIVLSSVLNGIEDRENGNIKSMTIGMNHFTKSSEVQAKIEQRIEKRSGRVFGPAAGRRLLCFVDDLNMPAADLYGTQPPLALLRQFLDSGEWFDRCDLSLRKRIEDVNLIAAMNHQTGSCSIPLRLQRHFVPLALEMPSMDELHSIYATTLKGSLEGMADSVQLMFERSIGAILEIFTQISSRLLPTAKNVHYSLSMHHLTSAFQGLARANVDSANTPVIFARLVLHEATRVFADRASCAKDLQQAKSIILGSMKKHFDAESEEVFKEPVLFTNFIVEARRSTTVRADSHVFQQACDGEEFLGVRNEAYICASSMEQLGTILSKKLEEHNQTSAKMPLVLFDMAIEHVCRICRIISKPGGHALLVGVGGSGKQSLTRLAAFACEYKLKQIARTESFQFSDLKEVLKGVYRQAVLQPEYPVVLMLNDADILDEQFLVPISDIVSTGFCEDLFNEDEFEALVGSLRAEAKAQGANMGSSETFLFSAMLHRARQSLHFVLCQSPVGDSFFSRASKIPSLFARCEIDWFHPWPRDALVLVAQRHLDSASLNSSEEVAENVAHCISDVHCSVVEMNKHVKRAHGRFNYVTPKSFLETLANYEGFLKTKRSVLQSGLHRLESGLKTLRRTADDVSKLQDDMQQSMLKVEERKCATEELLQEMAQQRAEAQAQRDLASTERDRAEHFAKKAKEIERDAESELALARPAIQQAEESINCLTKASLTELKSLTKPPAGVDKVTTCVLMMIKNEKKNFSWENAKRMMQNTEKFKQSLEKFDSKHMSTELIDRITPILSDPEFTSEKLMKKSSAAANMANWVINICEYNKIYRKVKPLMDRLEEAKTSKEKALADLKSVEIRMEDVESELAKLQESFMMATNEKARMEEAALGCKTRLALAERLVNGLSSENARWEAEMNKIHASKESVIGDSLLASAFVSYMGPFDRDERIALWRDQWTSDIHSRDIPFTEGITPVDMLVSDENRAQWSLEGLPVDEYSVENAAIVENESSRWLLFIDPQQQASDWLRQHFGGLNGERIRKPNKVAMKGSSIKNQRETFRNLSSTHARKSTRRSAVLLPSSKNGGDEDEEETESIYMELQTTNPSWLRELSKSVARGDVVLLENISETIDASLRPLLSKGFHFKGKQAFFHLEGQELRVNPRFRLILQTRASKPHFKPDVLAFCNLINFVVTETGFENQILSRVISLEKANLENERLELHSAVNSYRIELAELEDSLLAKLSQAPEDILADVPLIESLEATKKTAEEVQAAVVNARETEAGIDVARDVYRPVAAEASMLYFMLLQLGTVSHMYQFSMEMFIMAFEKVLQVETSARDSDDEYSPEKEVERVQILVRAVRLTISHLVMRGLLEIHRPVFAIQLTFNLLRRGAIELQFPEDDTFDNESLQFLIQDSQSFFKENVLSWLPNEQWQAVCGLAELLPAFSDLPQDMIESSTRFREWFNYATPETETLPLDWRALEKKPFQKILLIRALRPDRTLAALTQFVRKTLPDGAKFLDLDSNVNSFQILKETVAQSLPQTPIYLILSQGSTIDTEVDRLAKIKGLVEGKNYRNISLGQGQEKVAKRALEIANKGGGWVFLNNIHLMPKWLNELSNILDDFSRSKQHQGFRLFLSSNPSQDIPGSVLKRCIKLINEPSTGLKANLSRSWAQFSAEDVDLSDGNSRSALFGICFFHSVLLERKTYGTKGFNVPYPFSSQDLMACSTILRNHIESQLTSSIPWEDLQYMCGEIIYGGHIIDDFDRRVCRTYLNYYMNDKLLDEMEMFPFVEHNHMKLPGDEEEATARDSNQVAPPDASFKVLNLQTHEKYADLIHSDLAEAETPLALGMHPNAEIGFRLKANNSLLKILGSLQPQSFDGDEARQIHSPQHVAEATLQDILDTFRDFQLDHEQVRDALTTSSSGENADPYQLVLLQECLRMQNLVDCIVKSLETLERGFKGEVSISAEMSRLIEALYRDTVPNSWVAISYLTCRPLGAWLADLQMRIEVLQSFLLDPHRLPTCTWLPGFFNPSAFLNAILQGQARSLGVELDKLSLSTEVMRKHNPDEILEQSRTGRFVHGLYIEGASWNSTKLTLESPNPKDTTELLPVINIRAVPQQEMPNLAQVFLAPVYRTQQRSSTHIFTAILPTLLYPAEKWVLQQTVLLLDPYE